MILSKSDSSWLRLPLVGNSHSREQQLLVKVTTVKQNNMQVAIVFLKYTEIHQLRNDYNADQRFRLQLEKFVLKKEDAKFPPELNSLQIQRRDRWFGLGGNLSSVLNAD